MSFCLQNTVARFVIKKLSVQTFHEKSNESQQIKGSAVILSLWIIICYFRDNDLYPSAQSDGLL